MKYLFHSINIGNLRAYNLVEGQMWRDNYCEKVELWVKVSEERSARGSPGVLESFWTMMWRLSRVHQMCKLVEGGMVRDTEVLGGSKEFRKGIVMGSGKGMLQRWGERGHEGSSMPCQGLYSFILLEKWRHGICFKSDVLASADFYNNMVMDRRTGKIRGTSARKESIKWCQSDMMGRWTREW